MRSPLPSPAGTCPARRPLVRAFARLARFARPARTAGPPRPARPARLAPLALCLTVAALGSPAVRAAPVTRTLTNVPVSASQVYTQMTPVAVKDGYVFVTTLEPGPNGDGPKKTDLRVVVRQGVPNGSGGYTWTKQVVETRGVFDPWHTAASVGIDEAGYVHVAYNMHNFPWQYAVSRRPLDIAGGFEFRGQPMTQAELDRHTFQNATNFPDLGRAAVPGNQVTYPRFENDREGKLYLSYRFAATPNRAFDKRTFSTGLASYDVGSRTWTSLGGLPNYTPGDYAGPATATATLRAVASARGWTSYVPRLSFGPDGAVSLSTMWRVGIAGATTADPCVFRTRDGESFTKVDGAAVRVPAVPGNCPNVTSAPRGVDYLSIGDSASDEAGNPYLLLSPVGGTRTIHRWDGGRWVSEPSPGAAVEIFFDDDWNLWAVAQGMSLYLKRKGSSTWETKVQAKSAADCLPHAAVDPADRSVAHVFSMGCTADRAAVTRYDLQQLRGERVVADSRLPPLSLARNRWQQVSVPFAAPDMTPVGVFGAALPAAGYRRSWTLYGFDAAKNAYFEPAANAALQPGRGYWIIQDVKGRAVVNAPAGARPVPSTKGDRACNGPACGTVALPVRKGTPTKLGWSIGGAPVQRAAPIQDRRRAGTGGACASGCTLAQAAAAKLTGPKLYRFDAGKERYAELGAADRLEPWDGYWAAALPAAGAGGLRLLFPVVDAVANLEATAPIGPPPAGEPPGPTRGPTVDDGGL